MISTTPNGQAPARKPYTLDIRQPAANARMNAGWRRSRAYITIMKVTATTPKTVIRFIRWIRRRSDADRMPDRLHLHERGDELRAHLARLDLDHALDVLPRRLLDRRHLFRRAARDVDRVHVHVRAQPREQLAAGAADHGDHAGREGACCQHR